MRLIAYPEGDTVEVGAERWEVEWASRLPDGDEWDPADVTYEYECSRTREGAMRRAHELAARSVFGCAVVRHQVFEALPGEPGIGEWETLGEAEVEP